MTVCDLRSDTVTQPTDAMRAAIAAAPVGDDVFGEDPSIRALELRVAELLGMADAVFTASGCMANQLALMSHCRAGDSVVVPRNSHMVLFETGAAAAIAGVQLFEVGDDGHFDGDDVRRAARSHAYIYPPTRLVVVENTHNFAGGRVSDIARMRHIGEASAALGIPVHVDGARLPHAAAATGQTMQSLVAGATSASICLSKGLGAPMGSVLAGPADFVQQARRYRRMLGGGLRQAGLMAAGGLYALDHHMHDLRRDIDRAAQLAEALSASFAFAPIGRPESNIVVAETIGWDADAALSALAVQGVRAMAFGTHRIRFVFHRDITEPAFQRALAAAREVVP